MRAGSRFFTGSRQYQVTALSGAALFQVQGPMTWGRDRYRVTAPDGSPLAELVRRTTFHTTSVQVSVVDGTELRLEGNVLDHAYRLLAGEYEVAVVDRSWAGLAGNCWATAATPSGRTPACRRWSGTP